MIKTDKAIMHISMRRSGSNAISRFMYNLYDNPKIITGGKACWICRCSNRAKEFEKKDRYKPIFYSPYSSEKVLCRQEYMKLVILRQEDISVNGYHFKKENIVNWNNSVGQCCDLTFVLSMRDPFNMFASIFNQSYFAVEAKKVKNSNGELKLGKHVRSRLKKWIS